MIKKEYYRTRNDGVNLYITYSTNDYLIRKVDTEELYDQAIDIEGSNFQYEETNIKIREEVIEDEKQN